MRLNYPHIQNVDPKNKKGKKKMRRGEFLSRNCAFKVPRCCSYSWWDCKHYHHQSDHFGHLFIQFLLHFFHPFYTSFLQLLHSYNISLFHRKRVFFGVKQLLAILQRLELDLQRLELELQWLESTREIPPRKSTLFKVGWRRGVRWLEKSYAVASSCRSFKQLLWLESFRNQYPRER